MNNKRRNRLIMVFFLLFSTIVFSNKCIAQEQLKKELKSIYIEKNAKLRKDYYKVIYLKSATIIQYTIKGRFMSR